MVAIDDKKIALLRKNLQTIKKCVPKYNKIKKLALTFYFNPYKKYKILPLSIYTKPIMKLIRNAANIAY